LSNDVKVSDIISPNFHDLHKDIKADTYSEYWLRGGRGSTKSSFISLEIILGMMKDPLANTYVFRRYEAQLQESVVQQLQWAAITLGVEHLWRFYSRPYKAIYKPTEQKIVFRGADSPKNVKGAKISKGYMKYAWFEEVDQFGGMNDIRNLGQSLFRGTDEQQVSFFSYNPPKSARSWANAETKITKPGREVHFSDYRTVNPKWLGQRFLAEAEHLKKVNLDAYNHEYLGEEIGTGLEIFNNVTVRTIPDSEIAWFDNFYQGLDFGYAVDPLWFGEAHYDSKKRRLYIFSEISGIGISNRQLAERLTEEQKLRETIADSAEPKSIDELRLDHGCKMVGVKKGAGSIENGVKWLQDLEEIIIDPVRCPLAGKEFINYALDVTRSGDVISKYPDKDNHSIDGVRYLCSQMIKDARLQKLQKNVKIINMPVASRW
jgi:PBSX family phage terminase large subunit